jgi:chromosome partitioning protein
MTSLIGDAIRTVVSAATRPERGYHQAQVIAVCTRKGGVGKTTTAVNMAAGLAVRHEKKVLLIDMDGQGHCGSALHAELRGVARETVGDILLGRRRDIQEAVLPTAIPGLWITPSDKDLGTVEDVMASKLGKELLLRSALKIARTHYDYIVIDCPPNLGTLTVNAMMAADWALIPCDMSILALEGVDDIVETLDTLDDTFSHGLPVLGVLRTRVDLRNQKMNGRIEEALRSRYARMLLETIIPVNTRLAQAQMDGQPILNHDPTCSGAKAYDALLEELAPRLGL